MVVVLESRCRRETSVHSPEWQKSEELSQASKVIASLGKPCSRNDTNVQYGVGLLAEPTSRLAAVHLKVL